MDYPQKIPLLFVSYQINPIQYLTEQNFHYTNKFILRIAPALINKVLNTLFAINRIEINQFLQRNDQRRNHLERKKYINRTFLYIEIGHLSHSTYPLTYIEILKS